MNSYSAIDRVLFPLTTESKLMDSYLYAFDFQVWERMKLVIEPAAGCAVAAVLSPKFKELAGPSVKRVGVVLCGGNVDLSHIPWISNNS